MTSIPERRVSYRFDVNLVYLILSRGIAVSKELLKFLELLEVLHPVVRDDGCV